MKLKWLIADVTAVGFSTKAESNIFCVIFDAFGQAGPLLWLGRLSDVWKHYLGSKKPY